MPAGTIAQTRSLSPGRTPRREDPGAAPDRGLRVPRGAGFRPWNLSSWPSLLKRFREMAERLDGSAWRSKRRPSRKKERKVSKMALAVQPQVNSSVSPAADGSNGQETTAENKAPRCSAGPARFARTRPLPGAVPRGREKGFRSRPPLVKED